MMYQRKYCDGFPPCGETSALGRGLRRALLIVLSLICVLQGAGGISLADEGAAAEPAAVSGPAPWPGPVPWVKPAPWPGPAPWALRGPWPGPVPPPEDAPEAEPGLLTEYAKVLEKTVDETHAKLERNILRQAVRFDTFFGEVKPENVHKTSYNLRWRNSIRVEQGRNWHFGSSLYANFALSRISERLHLFFTGEDEPTLNTQSLPSDPGNPGFDRTTPTTHFANTELRYELIRNHSLNLFLGTGVRLVLPFEVFARSRVQYTHDFSDLFLMRVAETLFVKNTDLFGETTEFSLERLLGETTLLRWANSGTASKEIKGLEWGSELSSTWQLSPKDAITLKGGLFGTITTDALIQNHLVLVRYRRNFLRSWLFYELEPQVSWPRNPDGSKPPIYAFTFRIEVVFNGTHVE